MPGMSDMSVKLIFSRKNGVIIGGHMCGGPSVGEAINIIGATIQKRMTADDIATFQVGTHPALTASPIAYQITNAAEIALTKMQMRHSTFAYFQPSAVDGGKPALRFGSVRRI